MKLWCCGITSNEEENIKDLIESTKDYVDGFCWTVHTDSKDRTLQILEENKKEGVIIQVPYIKFHDISANFWLHCGAIKNKDWVIINDSKEKLTEYWLKLLRKDLEKYEKNDIGAVYCSGRPYLFKFYDFQSFNFTPHWALGYPVGKITTIPEEQKSQFIINKRLSDPTNHFCLHDIKYMWEFGVSNQVPAFYNKYGEKIVQQHELMRLGFRYKCQEELGIDLNLKSLEDYLKNNQNQYPQWLIDYFETEFSFSEFFRLKVLDEDFMKDIVPRRERWSFKNFIQYGDGFYDKEYLGTRLRYDKELNK